jgi:hypothetical protein
MLYDSLEHGRGTWSAAAAEARVEARRVLNGAGAALAADGGLLEPAERPRSRRSRGRRKDAIAARTGTRSMRRRGAGERVQDVRRTAHGSGHSRRARRPGFDRPAGWKATGRPLGPKRRGREERRNAEDDVHPSGRDAQGGRAPLGLSVLEIAHRNAIDTGRARARARSPARPATSSSKEWFDQAAPSQRGRGGHARPRLRPDPYLAARLPDQA